MFIILGIFIGFILPIQTSINTKLSHVFRSPIVSTTISCVIGGIPLLALTLLHEGTLFISTEQMANIPWWAWTSGLLGILYLMNCIILFQKLGASQAAILPILGQIVTSLMVDYFGWFNSPIVPFHLLKALGIVLVIIGVFGTVPKTSVQTTQSKYHVLYQLLGIFTGAITALQTAISGRLGSLLQSSLKASSISFLVSVLICLLLLIVLRPFPSKAHLKAQEKPFWIWFGGIIGATFILGTTFLAPQIGTGLAVLTSLLGITLGGYCVEYFGWFHTPKQKITLKQLISLLIMFIGVIVIQSF